MKTYRNLSPRGVLFWLRLHQQICWQSKPFISPAAPCSPNSPTRSPPRTSTWSGPGPSSTTPSTQTASIRLMFSLSRLNISINRHLQGEGGKEVFTQPVLLRGLYSLNRKFPTSVMYFFFRLHGRIYFNMFVFVHQSLCFKCQHFINSLV